MRKQEGSLSIEYYSILDREKFPSKTDKRNTKKPSRRQKNLSTAYGSFRIFFFFQQKNNGDFWRCLRGLAAEPGVCLEAGNNMIIQHTLSRPTMSYIVYHFGLKNEGVLLDWLLIFVFQTDPKLKKRCHLVQLLFLQDLRALVIS